MRSMAAAASSARRTVLVTGGTTGLGLEAARQMLSQGTSVVVTARNEVKATQALRTLK
jgi:uncharacterized oxidoreductase